SRTAPPITGTLPQSAASPAVGSEPERPRCSIRAQSTSPTCHSDRATRNIVPQLSVSGKFSGVGIDHTFPEYKCASNRKYTALAQTMHIYTGVENREPLRRVHTRGGAMRTTMKLMRLVAVLLPLLAIPTTSYAALITYSTLGRFD